MIQALLPGALAFTMLASQITPAPLSSYGPSSSVVEKQKLILMAKTEESLQSISKIYYGDEKYWTTLWNSNEQVSDPHHIPPGTLLTIPASHPQNPEDLSQKITETYVSHVSESVPEVHEQVVTGFVQSASVSAVISPEPIFSISPTPTVTEQVSPKTLTDAQITFLGNCEAGMVASRNSGNGYYGAFQFSYGTWQSMGTGYERADLAPIEVQIDAVQRLVARSSIYTQFPACSRAMHAAGIL